MGRPLRCSINHKQSIEFGLRTFNSPVGVQAFSVRARQALSEKVRHSDIKVEWRQEDKERRLIGQVFLEGRWINREMVEEGWARQASESPILVRAEVTARECGSACGLIPTWFAARSLKRHRHRQLSARSRLTAPLQSMARPVNRRTARLAIAPHRLTWRQVLRR